MVLQESLPILINKKVLGSLRAATSYFYAVSFLLCFIGIRVSAVILKLHLTVMFWGDFWSGCMFLVNCFPQQTAFL